MSMSRQIPFMSDRQLAGLTASPAFGSLALVEVSRRNRDRLMADAKKQAMAAGGSSNSVADRELAALAQQRFSEQLAADESMGLNNIVAQAEQGGLEFGSPYGAGAIGESDGEMPMGAGGGMVAFERGGEVPGFAAGAFIPLALRALSMYGPRVLPRLGMEAGKRGIGALKAHPYITGGLGIASGVPFGLGMMGDDKIEGIEGFGAASDEVYQGAAGPRGAGGPGAGRGAGGGGASARAGISGLDLETDPRESLRKRRELEKEAGLGEFGAKAKEIREGRKARVEKTIERALESEPYLAGAEAAGQVRPTGRRGLAGLLDVAAPTVAAMGKSAAGIQRQRTEALDKLAEGEERLALAEEQYLRGDIKDATTRADQAKKDIFTSNLQLRQLDALENYRKAQLAVAAARATGVGGLRIDPVRATRDINELQEQLRMLDPKKDKAAIAEKQRNIQMLKGLIGMSLARGTGATIEED